MSLWSSFSKPAKPSSTAYRFAMLAVCLCLLAGNIHWRAQLSPDYPYHRYDNTVVVLMLLFNHLAYQFRWPTPVTVALRIVAWAWIAFGVFYLFHWSHRLYP